MLNWFVIFLISGLGFVIYRLLGRVRRLEFQIRQNEQEREVVFSFLNKIGQSVTSEMEVEKALEFTVEFIVEETGAESGAVFVLDPRAGLLRARVAVGLFPPLQEIPEKAVARKKFLLERLKKEQFPLGASGGLVGLSAQSGEMIVVNDVRNDKRVLQTCPDIITIRQFLAAPLKTRDRVLGVIALVNKQSGGGFDEHDRKIIATLGDQAAVTLNIIQLYQEMAEKQRMEQELRLAQNFQEMLLPKTFPDVKELEVFGLSRPALEVGGDYFDIFLLDERLLGVVIADVSGKGIPGALVMAAVRSNLRAESRRLRRPREVLRKVNTDMLADTKESVFITMTYAVIDLDRMTLCFARAGHEPLISSHDGTDQLAFHTPAGVAVGMTDDAIFSSTQEMEIPLQPNQLVILYTDGLTEAMDAGGREYGLDRFTTVIKSNAHLPPKQLCDRVLDDIRRFCGEAPQYDDMTMIALRARPEAFAAHRVEGRVVEMNGRRG
ncbi:MAG: hypothetical protein Kow0059_02560 [Candidatus Sumerlaeia bacterium]